MKFLLSILLFFALTSTAQVPSVAMNMTATKMEPGVLIAGNALSVFDKAALAKDSMNCKSARMAFIISTWNGSSASYEAYRAKGLNLIPNINYYPTGSVQPFVVASLLANFKSVLTDILNTYPDIKTICVENEELTKSYHSGPLTDYVAEVKAAYEVCHPRGVLVMNGGFGGVHSGLDIKVYRWLQTISQAKADDYGTHMGNAVLNAANSFGSNDNQEKYARQLDTLEAMRPYIDFLNFHTKESQDPNNTDPSNTTTVTPNMLMDKADYLRSRYGRWLADNETGQFNNQPALVSAEMNEYLRLGFVVVQWWSGTGPDGDEGTQAQPLHDDETGDLFPNGRVFNTFNYNLNK